MEKMRKMNRKKIPLTIVIAAFIISAIAITAVRAEPTDLDYVTATEFDPYTDYTAGAKTSYGIGFVTATEATIATVEIEFPEGFDVSDVTLGLIENIDPGAVSVWGQVVNYTLFEPALLPDHTMYTYSILLRGVVNTLDDDLYTVSVTTKDEAGDPVDGPTKSDPFTIKEGVSFDAEHYKTGTVATVTVVDISQEGMGTVAVWVGNVRTDQELLLSLSETDDTGIFVGMFTLVGTTPGTGEMLTRHADLIWVHYDPLEDDDVAFVDDEEPEIGFEFGPEGLINDATPEIGALMADWWFDEFTPASGIDERRIVMKVDGDVVDYVYAPFDEVVWGVLYEPTADLSQGDHTVTVDVSDLVGNPAETFSWSFTVDTEEPKFEVEYYSDEDLTEALPTVEGVPVTKAGMIWLKITADEPLDGIPTFDIDQQGTEDVYSQGTTLVDGNVYKGSYEVHEADEGYVDGSASVTITGTDLAKNTAEDATPTVGDSFLIDTTPPIAPVEANLDITENWPGTADTIEGQAEAVEAYAEVTVYSDSELTDVIDTATATAEGSFPAIDIGDNLYAEVWVTATDAVGNEGEATSALNDVEAPEITMIAWEVEEAPEWLVEGDTINITLTGEAGCTATFDIDALATGELLEEPPGTYTGSYTVLAGDDGFYLITAYLTDDAGNVATIAGTTESENLLFRVGGAATAGIAEWSSEEVHSGKWSVKLETVAGSDYASIRIFFEDTKLDDLTSLSYWDFVAHTCEGNEHLEVFLDIWLDWDKNGILTWDDVYGYMQAEPCYTYGTRPMNEWHFSDGMNMRWETYWGGSPCTAPTIYDFQENNELAQQLQYTNGTDYGDLYVLVLDVRVGFDGGWSNFVGYADDVMINGVIYNLEQPIGVDTTPPSVTNPTAPPAPADGVTETTLTVDVTDDVLPGITGSGVDSVEIDLTLIDLGPAEPMYDNGTHGDETSGDGTYSLTITVPIGVEDDTYLLPVTATDVAGNENTEVSISLQVLTDTEPPIFVSTTVEYPIGAVSARPGDPVIVSAVVTDITSGVESVVIDLTPIGGTEEDLALVGDDTWSIEFNIGSEVTPDTYTLTLTATDASPLVNLADTTVDVLVTSTLTGYNIQLVEGWNLISLPLIPDSSSIEVILADIEADVDKVWAYDAETGLWSGLPGTLTEMVDGKGYWINMTAPATLTIHGTEMPVDPLTPMPTYHVVPGWNLIGFKEIDEDTADIYLAGVECVRIWSFEHGVWVPVPAPPEAGTMKPGLGYWIAVTAEGWIYP